MSAARPLWPLVDSTGDLSYVRRERSGAQWQELYPQQTKDICCVRRECRNHHGASQGEQLRAATHQTADSRVIHAQQCSSPSRMMATTWDLLPFPLW